MRANLNTRLTPRQLVLLGVPLVLGILELTHLVISGPPGVFGQVRPQVGYWIALHLIQLPLFSLLALAAYLLLDGNTRRAATVARVALAVFVIFYPAFDALLGIAVGVLVNYAGGLPADQQAAVATAIDHFWNSRVVYAVMVLGDAGWLVGLIAAAVALTRPTVSHQLVQLLAALAAAVAFSGLVVGANDPLWWAGVVIVVAAFAYAATPRLPAALLAGAALLFSANHAPPYGPLGMLCLLSAVVLLELPVGQRLAALARPRSAGGRPPAKRR